jgi:hypothetical protein
MEAPRCGSARLDSEPRCRAAFEDPRRPGGRRGFPVKRIGQLVTVEAAETVSTFGYSAGVVSKM